MYLSYDVCVNIISGSSNPRPLLRWTETDAGSSFVAIEANRTFAEPASHGGEKVTSVVEFAARPEHDGKGFACTAENPTIADRPPLAAKVRLVVLCEFSQAPNSV